MLRKWIGIVLLAGLVVGTASAAFYTEPFDGTKLDARWTHRTPDGNDKYALTNGWFVWDIQASQDLYVQGTDFAPMLLTDPPSNDKSFTIETKVNVLYDSATQPPASQAGLILFNESKWAYTLWGPYANTDIRVEDCIGGGYRWRDTTLVGVNKIGDKDVWLKIVKTGDELEFFYKDAEGDAWTSGGKDANHIGPQLEKGKYKVGLFVKNWGGSVAMKVAFDYFDSPELGAKAVDPQGKVAATWADLKREQ